MISPRGGSEAGHPESVILALSVSLGIGIFFGMRAQRTGRRAWKPIDALRYE
ncbi:MAG: hypothetical protein R2856_04745 [Caldilineaceae bacterium]